MMATVIAAAINVALNFICIRKFGYQAAAYTTLICYILYCLFHYINMRRIEKEKIYNSILLIVFSAVYVALCFACLYIYDYPFVRYGILIVVVITVLVNRKRITHFYNQLARR